MRHQSSTAERVIARIAGRQHGNATRQQLLREGITLAEIRHRIASGALIPVFPGVYRVGHRAPSLEAHYMAAVLACGDGARLAEHAAAFLLGLTKRPPSSPIVSAVTHRRIAGIKTTRRHRDDDADTVRANGIPTTSPARTLVDLAATLAEPQLARACHEAHVRHRTAPHHVEAVLERRPNAKGATALRRILTGDAQVLLSRLEARFQQRLAERGLPRPHTNRPAGAHYVDCRWPEHRLTVELDSYRFHNTRHSWEQDREREREARVRGDELRRYTWHDVEEDPEPMLADLEAALSRAGPRRFGPVGTGKDEPREPWTPRAASGTVTAW